MPSQKVKKDKSFFIPEYKKSLFYNSGQEERIYLFPLVIRRKDSKNEKDRIFVFIYMSICICVVKQYLFLCICFRKYYSFVVWYVNIICLSII